MLNNQRVIGLWNMMIYPDWWILGTTADKNRRHYPSPLNFWSEKNVKNDHVWNRDRNCFHSLSLPRCQIEIHPHVAGAKSVKSSAPYRIPHWFVLTTHETGLSNFWIKVEEKTHLSAWWSNELLKKFCKVHSKISLKTSVDLLVPFRDIPKCCRAARRREKLCWQHPAHGASLPSGNPIRTPRWQCHFWNGKQ